MTDPDDCLHFRLDYTDSELICRECDWRMPRVGRRENWIAHMRQTIAGAKKPTPPRRLPPRPAT